MKVPLRKNVLILVCSGYFTLLVIFFMMVLMGDIEPGQAYDVVKSPLMALIGGSLAISKDLIPLSDGKSVDFNNNPDHKKQKRKNQSATDNDEN